MIELEIDGKKVKAAQGDMLIEAAESAGIYIPRFCYHKKLSVVANCRMCLVECENSRKPLPACATPVTPGMKVYTRSKVAKDAQRAVMEFLLINHPLDCPICDQGGECELQDLAMGYGRSISRFTEGKRSIKDKNLGPLIATDMTRCIHCTRCVRFGEEIAGVRELGATGRGENVEIGTYIEKAVESELSGNIIDLCPVGALTSKPYRFKGRAWEFNQHANISPHDCVGTNIYIHTRFKSYDDDTHVMRIVPKDNELINETWITDRDRFSYEGYYTDDRIKFPQIKRHGKWEVVDWPTALKEAAIRIRDIVSKEGSHQIGAVAHPNTTIESLFLFQKIMRAMGSSNVDHRLHAQDTSDQGLAPIYPSLGVTLPELETQDVILLIGSNIRHEQPLICHRIRKSALRGAKVVAIHSVNYALNFPVTEKIIVSIDGLEKTLSGVAKALSERTTQPVPDGAMAMLADITPEPKEIAIAGYLLEESNALVLLGELVEQHPEASRLRTLAHLITLLSGATYGQLTSGANSAGGWLAGMVPHRIPGGEVASEPGISAHDMWKEKLKAYLLLGIEPEFDCADAPDVLSALHQAECVVSLSSYRSDVLEKVADIILPIALFAESPGTFVNVEGRWQSFKASTLPLGEARPDWKVLRVLGNLLSLDGFEYCSSTEVLSELKSCLPEQINTCRTWQAHANKKESAQQSLSLMRLGYWPMYRIDAIVRRATALQQTQSADLAAVRVCPAVADRLGLKNGDAVIAIQAGNHIPLTLCIDSTVGDNVVVIAAGLPNTYELGPVCGPVVLQKDQSRRVGGKC